jgi:hypothetical protein
MLKKVFAGNDLFHFLFQMLLTSHISKTTSVDKTRLFLKPSYLDKNRLVAFHSK